MTALDDSGAGGLPAGAVGTLVHLNILVETDGQRALWRLCQQGTQVSAVGAWVWPVDDQQWADAAAMCSGGRYVGTDIGELESAMESLSAAAGFPASEFAAVPVAWVVGQVRDRIDMVRGEDARLRQANPKKTWVNVPYPQIPAAQSWNGPVEAVADRVAVASAVSVSDPIAERALLLCAVVRKAVDAWNLLEAERTHRPWLVTTTGGRDPLPLPLPAD